MRHSIALAFCLSCLLVVSLSSCKEDENPIIYVSPDNLQVTLEEGGVVEFDVELAAGSHELRNIQITQKPIGGITTTLLDSTIYGKSAQFFWVYTPPIGADNVVLTFTIYDQEGNKNATIRRVIIEGQTSLVETSGLELFSPYTTAGNNAFNLAGLTGYQLAANPDSTLIDLTELDLTDDSVPGFALTSLSGIQFVRNNGFNYAQATNESVESNYNSSSPLSIISNVAINDIIIARYDTVLNKYAVIKITGIANEAGDDLDRYFFNVKK
jgi:hypothetical protein